MGEENKSQILLFQRHFLSLDSDLPDISIHKEQYPICMQVLHILLRNSVLMF